MICYKTDKQKKTNFFVYFWHEKGFSVYIPLIDTQSPISWGLCALMIPLKISWCWIGRIRCITFVIHYQAEPRFYGHD